ncbi:hypothetical protein [Streptomyces alkaliterrae]|uniref:Integral membrane protein n=1 Tax=Streptomyces alkaliterrae TaxID=2213162 RepID=A0A7W3WWY4_9ACTN|nr:hypothetical protein [Streptomyces alkaliterrae]MBB1253397.1 hypothetical protein [Streptomyces alkaliterrae]MBB1260018.1 hypothetical protein [Streptomyces alkaliterrae]
MYVPVVRASAGLRLLRAAVFTAACVALSAAAHLVAGGGAVPLWTLGVAVAAVFAVAVSLAGRERALPGIAAALALGQLALHTLFTTGHLLAARGSRDDGRLIELARGLLCGERAAALSLPQARAVLADAGLGHHASAAAPAPADAQLTLSVLDCVRLAVRGALATASGPMLLGHLAAALAAGWLLRRGEAALWRLVRLSVLVLDGVLGEVSLRALRDALAWARALVALRAGDVRASEGRRVAEDGSGAPPEPEALRHAVVRRGPPARPQDFALTA